MQKDANPRTTTLNYKMEWKGRKLSLLKLKYIIKTQKEQCEIGVGREKTN